MFLVADISPRSVARACDTDIGAASRLEDEAATVSCFGAISVIIASPPPPPCCSFGAGECALLVFFTRSLANFADKLRLPSPPDAIRHAAPAAIVADTLMQALTTPEPRPALGRASTSPSKSCPTTRC